jgi:hypothetical protein
VTDEEQTDGHASEEAEKAHTQFFAPPLFAKHEPDGRIVVR